MTHDIVCIDACANDAQSDLVVILDDHVLCSEETESTSTMCLLESTVLRTPPLPHDVKCWTRIKRWKSKLTSSSVL